MPGKREHSPRWRTILEVTVAVSAILGFVLSLMNTWWALDPGRHLTATVLFGDLETDGSSPKMGTINTAIAIQNNGARREVVLSQALGLGKDQLTYRSKTPGERNPFYPGRPLEVGAGEVRVIEMNIPVDLQEAFGWVRLNPSIFPAPAGLPADVVAAPFGARIVILDPNGDRVETFLPITSLWFAKDGSVKQTSGSTPTVSLLGDSKNAVRWPANHQ